VKVNEATPAVLLALLVLAWLPLRKVDADAASAVRTLTILDRFASAENAASRDVLSARAGILRYYDPLVEDERQIDTLLADLTATQWAGRDQETAFEALQQATADQWTLVEQFKSDNALLQNSLAYFQVFSNRLGTSQNAETASSVMALDAAMLQLTLDTSPAAAQTVADRLAHLTLPTEPADVREGLPAYGHRLNLLLPETDGLLAKLRAVPITQRLDELRRVTSGYEAASRDWASRLRLLLYLASLILFGLLVYFARGLRLRAWALRERASFEHAIAGTSLAFLDAQADEIDALIGDTLRKFSTRFGAARAYLIEIRKSQRTHSWCAPEAPPPVGWPDRFPALAESLDATDTGVIHVPNRKRLPPGPLRTALADAEVQGWLFMASAHGDGARHILAFEATSPCRLTENADLSFVRVLLDVMANATNKHALEQEKIRLAARLQQAHRMETIGALASGVAHNFNNLIGAIQGHTEMAESETGCDDRIAANLSEIRKASDRARALVEQILSFGRPRRTQFSRISIEALLDEAASLLRPTLPPHVELTVRPMPAAIAVAGELAQLQQVILNLCNNAAQAMPSPGRIDITATLQEVREDRTLDHGNKLTVGRNVCIAVTDTGRGMTEEIRRRIFEPFYTTRQAGNGLGLATVKAIVIEHGGAIGVESTLGTGSRFEVWLPWMAPSASPAEDRAPSRIFDHLKTILLVDDDRERLYRDEEILAAIGYEPVGFTSPGDALAACRNAPGRFDAAILGRAAAAALSDFTAVLRDSAAGLPILLATPADDRLAAASLAAAGIQEVVRSPLDPAEIAEALYRWLDNSRTATAAERDVMQV
jgi:signal transduction histidine kinase